jgi:hypothetical protein
MKMETLTVLVIITLVLVCLCCLIYIENHVRKSIAFIVRVVLKELADDGMEEEN